MTRLAGHVVEVHRSDDIPAQLRWRGRLYEVREVLDRWVGTARWWSAPATDAGPDVDDREHWRVLAAPAGRGAAVALELVFDSGTGRWTVARTLD